MANHGVFANEKGTAVSTPVQVQSGIPFVVGCAPVQAADMPATAGVPVLCTSWDETVQQLGYSDDWKTYTLCEVMDSHFKRYGMQPIIFVNVFDPTTMKESKSTSILALSGHTHNLGDKAILDSELTVKSGSGETQEISEGTDYEAYFNDKGELIIEMISTSEHYNDANIEITYNAAKFDNVNASAIVKGIEAVELCTTLLGTIPDLLMAPGYSEDSSVAAALAAKAASINGLFRAKALVDISTDTEKGGADVYANVVKVKNEKGFTDLNMIDCWPMVSLGGKVYHMSTHMAGVIASTDAANGAPHGSPSNRTMRIDGLVTAKGDAVLLTLAQANTLNNNGIMTALNFMGGFVAWGNYTACYPGNTDVKDYFIPVSRMFDWVANTLITTFWSRLDTPMTRRMVDSIVDSANIWLNGLTGSGYILGGRVEMSEGENPISNLMQGIVKFHVYLTPPSPAQEIDFSLEYDVSYLEAAFAN